jgi:hypothetical protein
MRNMRTYESAFQRQLHESTTIQAMRKNTTSSTAGQCTIDVERESSRIKRKRMMKRRGRN